MAQETVAKLQPWEQRMLFYEVLADYTKNRCVCGCGVGGGPSAAALPPSTSTQACCLLAQMDPRIR